MNITVLGAGAFGSALGSVLTENHHNIQYFDPYKYPNITLEQALVFSATTPSIQKPTATSDSQGSAPTAIHPTTTPDAIILATPSHVASDLLSQLPTSIPLICASKGFLSMQPFQNFTNFSIISGPAFAEMLMEKQSVTLTATSPFVIELFSTPWLTFDRTTDRLGVLLCGTLKNIYAIGAGYASTMAAWGEHEPSQYLSAALTEIKNILTANSADPTTADLACGIGDLTLTCSSTQSRNYQFGQSLAQAQLQDTPTSLSQDTTAPPSTTPQTTPPGNTTIEGLSALQAVANSPDFIIPPDCTIFNHIKELVHAHQA